MNQIQKISQKILCDRLKPQLGLDLAIDVDYNTLRAMSQQARNKRLQQLARAEASYIGLGGGQPA